MEKVFVSINAQGEITIRPVKDDGGKKDSLPSTDLHPCTDQIGRVILDSRGRLKLPDALRRYLRNDIAKD